MKLLAKKNDFENQFYRFIHRPPIHIVIQIQTCTLSRFRVNPAVNLAQPPVDVSSNPGVLSSSIKA